MAFHVPNHYRVRRGYMASDEGNGNNGVFFVPSRPGQPPFTVIASDGAIEPGGLAWEHVSVSLPHRCPTWAEMCAIKALFWGPEDTVVQYHPPRSEYVNNHPTACTCGGLSALSCRGRGGPATAGEDGGAGAERCR